MDLLGHIVQRSFGRAIDGIGHGNHLHPSDRACRGSNGDEFGRLSRILEQWENGLKQDDHTDDVDLVVFEKVRNLSVFDQGKHLHDAGIGDNNVERRDLVGGSKLLYSSGGVGLGVTVDLDDDERTRLSAWDLVEGLARLAGRVSHGSHDGVIGSTEIRLDKPSS